MSRPTTKHPLVQFALSLLLGLAGCTGFDGPADGWDTVDVILSNASLVTMESDTVLPNHTLAISSGRITWIGSADVVPTHHEAAFIDAQGRYVLPGLIDLHVHAAERDLPLFLAAGVTTVLFKHGTPEVLEWRTEAERGDRTSPRIFSAGPLISGRKIHWPHAVAASTDEASVLVQEHADAGYDFIKVYDLLNREAYGSLAMTAQRIGIPFLGHLPEAVGIEEALAAGQHCVDHAEQLVYAAVGRERAMEIRSAEVDSIVERLVRPGACLTSTLFGMKTMMMRGTPWFDSLFTRPEMSLVDAGTQEWWNTFRGTAPSAAALARRAHFSESQRYLTKRLFERGITLVAGTDTPNLLLIPGFALHDELRVLVDEVGLTSFEALQTATTRAAAMLGRPRDIGSIVQGASADLIVVDANPLENLNALRQPTGVMILGRWYDQQDLNRLLAFTRNGSQR
jgi:imidazolonepropionase-like amidohydrolase